MNALSFHTKFILKGLFTKKRIGGKHTEEKNCFRCLKHLSKEEQKLVYDEWNMCINEGWVLKMKKTGEWHVSLNPRMLKEIRRLLS